MENSLKKKNKRTLGGWIQTGSPYVAEIMANTRHFDWICIDLEHGVMDSVGTLNHIIDILDKYGILPVVRVPKNDYKWIGRSLDAGAKGIIVPMVNTVEEAIAAVEATKYPPVGKRSFGYSKSNVFGANFDKCLKEEKDDIALIVQIEHEQAMINLRGILGVDGIDGTFIGPLDLKGSIDISMKDLILDKWLDSYVDISRELGVPAGIHIVEPNEHNVLSAHDKGYKIVAVGTDAVLLRQGIERLL